MTSNSNNLIFGYKTNFVNNIRELLTSQEESINFLVIPLFHPRLRRDNNGISLYRTGSGTRSDRELESKDWISNVVGLISNWIDLDNNSVNISKSSELALKQEFQWSLHLGLQAILLPKPSIKCQNYARFISQISNEMSSYQQLWLTIPLLMGLDSCNNNKNNNNDSNYNNSDLDEYLANDGWLLWDRFRHISGHNHKISIALEISEEFSLMFTALMSNKIDGHTNIICEHIMKRWAAEPVKSIIISTKIFLLNKKNYPVLSKPMQILIGHLVKFKVQIIFSGKPLPTPIPINEAKKLLAREEYRVTLVPYMQYIQHIRTKNITVMTDGEKFCANYKDTLQCPLQPLMDNLESSTYETFERDPVKYDRYEEAISKALKHIRSNWNNDNDENIETVIITVVGAGRGPLVACAISAASNARIPVKIYAVEKNPNAIITLRNRVITEYWTNVNVIATDMRRWQPTELADIMVSELLGSWGDNELSPECLDGAQKCLKLNGISIPANYTSFLAPISTSKLWMGARDLLNGNGLNSPYVVMFHNSYEVATAKPLFTFDHPNHLPIEQIDNTRHDTVSFTATISTTIHGFAGTFESTLYKDVMLSIVPETHSTGMFSWFPLFIPLTSPIRIDAGETITISVWRCVNDRKVWYEWCLVQPVCTAIQNVNGKSYYIGL